MTIPLDLPITEIPIACELTESELAARRQHVLSGLWHKIEGQKELADGYAFRFPGTDDVAQELLAFALVERQCCSFFQIELAFTPGKGAIWLHLRGGEDVKQFIEAEFLGSQVQQKRGDYHRSVASLF